MRRTLIICIFILSALGVAMGQTTTARRLSPSTFANLGSQPDGSVRFCTNCLATSPCTSGGTGAEALRVDGAWNCSKGGPGASGTVTTSGSPASPQLAKFSSGTAITTATATDVSTPVQCLDAGSTDDYACNLSPSISSYVDGANYRFWAATANTSTATLNLNGIGAVQIRKGAGNTALVTGDILAGQWIDVVYNAGFSRMQMMSPLASTGNVSYGTSTTGKLTKWLSTTGALGDSIVTESGSTVTVAGTLTANGTNLVEGLLSTTAGVDLTSATATTLYTCPAAKTCLITKVIARNSSSSDPSDGSWSFGWNSAAFNDVISNQFVSTLDDPTYYKVLALKSRPEVGATGEVFKVLMNTVTGAAATMTIDVFGYVY